MITYRLLDKYTEIAHFCTSREGGVSVGNYASNNLSPFSGDNPEHFNENKRMLCNKLDIDPSRLIIPYQNHGTEVREISQEFFQLSPDKKAAYLNGVDAIFTQLPQVCISITTADCVPLLFFDPTKRVIAAAHAGWRGTCARIAEKTIAALTKTYSCRPADICVVIGPSISAKVYEVGQEVIDNFGNAGFDLDQIVIRRNESIFLDLWEANRQSMLSLGILPEHIEVSGICTFTQHQHFFSARQLGIKSGRILSGIMLKGV